MASSKKKKTSHMNRTDIPYAERLRMNKNATIAAHRDAAHLIELKLSLVSLNEVKGMGYVQLHPALRCCIPDRSSIPRGSAAVPVRSG